MSAPPPPEPPPAGLPPQGLPPLGAYGPTGLPPQGPVPGRPPGSAQGASPDPSRGSPSSDAAGRSEPATPKRNVSVGQILGGILLVVVVVFVLENTRSVKVRLIFPQVSVPLAVPIVIAAVLGALVAALLRYRRKIHHSPDRVKRSSKR